MPDISHILVASNSYMVLMSILTWKLCIQLYSCCTHRQVVINLTKVLKMQLHRNIDMHKAFKHSYVLNFCRQSLEKICLYLNLLILKCMGEHIWCLLLLLHVYVWNALSLFWIYFTEQYVPSKIQVFAKYASC